LLSTTAKSELKGGNLVAAEPEQGGEHSEAGPPFDESKLIQLAKNGSVAAFEQLVEAYDQKLYNMAYRMMGNREDARDMTQEAFLRAYRSLDGFREESSFSTWIFRIAKNACLDRIRKRSQVQAVSIDEPIQTEEGQVQRELPSELGDPEEYAEQQELSAVVHSALQELTDEYRTAVVLRDLQGFSYNEIAEVMEVSLGTVKSRIYRGRQALKEVLSGLELFSHVDVQNSERRPGS
jgi:RNA polymerase sigma-70 factor (ECF subfamily)